MKEEIYSTSQKSDQGNQENITFKVDNAIIMAAGLSSRFAPLSYEYPKALLKVKGEVLIERQIKQLISAGIEHITIVVGYKSVLFEYLKDKFHVDLVYNPDYDKKNNIATLFHVRERLKNTYICSADNYFTENVFEPIVEDSYYSAVFDEGQTAEWCIDTDENGLITSVKIGGENSWIMLGHAFFSEQFSEKFVSILEEIYDEPETGSLLWESVYIAHMDKLSMQIRKYSKDMIFEFDSLDELRAFDETYMNASGSRILIELCEKLGCKESEIVESKPLSKNGETYGFSFLVSGKHYRYLYKTNELEVDNHEQTR
ncbi:MAG: NTP transferase domain-containing protein [Clostridiaceae bacterium]